MNKINVKTPINNKEKAMKTKDEYIESLASELKEWSAQIDLLAGLPRRRTQRQTSS
jgi:hypothetical protein